MKKLLLLTFFISLYFNASAQHRDVQIQDSILYWINWVPEKPWKPLTADGRTLTPGQKAEMYRMVDWMMQSYHPVGGVGSFKTILNVRTSSDFKDYRPHNYYIDFRVWNVSYDNRDAKGNFKAVSEEYIKFPVGFNQIPSNPIEFLNGPENCYFTWLEPDDQSGLHLFKNADPKISANYSPFIVRNNAVILAPNNKLPFHRVTIGEFLDACEAALPYAMGVEKAHKDPKYQDGIPAEYEKYRTWIGKWKKAYAGKLDQPATVETDQATLSGMFAQNVDPFRKIPGSNYEVWKMNPEVFEKAKQDKPLFITFAIPHQTSEDGIQAYEMYQALTQNVNYQYIYDYYFDPEKVKGKTYKPADEPGMLKRLSGYKGTLPNGTKVGNGTGPSGKPNTITAPKKAPGVLIDDDFASAPIGRMPPGWYVRSVGKPSSLETVKGLEGNWLKLGSNNATFPTTLPKTLPKNFTLDLDVVTPADFGGRTGGQLLIHFSNGTGYSVNGDETLRPDRTLLDLKLIAGSDADRVAGSNFRGGIELEMHESKGPNTEHNREGLYFKKALPDFTSARTKIHVTMEMTEGKCTVYVNNKKVIDPTEMKLSYDSKCAKCGLSEGIPFSLVNFRNVDDSGEGLAVYIGNVRLVGR